METYIIAALAAILLLVGVLAWTLYRSWPVAFLASAVGLAAALCAWAAPGLAVALLPALLKGALALCLLAAFAGAMPVSAGVRHFLWTLGVVAVVLVPATALLAPRWEARAAAPPMRLTEVARRVDSTPMALPQPAAPRAAPTTEASAPPAVVALRTTFLLGRALGALWAFGAAALLMRLLIRLRRLGPGRARAMNDAGQIVGSCRVGVGHHACIWSSSRSRRIIGQAGVDSDAWRINARGSVIGSTDETGRVAPQAFFWSPKSGYQMIEVPRSRMVSADDLNDRDEVALSVIDRHGLYHAFVWSPTGGLRDITPYDGRNWSATEINSRGQVLGTVFSGDWNAPDGHADERPFLWTPE